MSITYRFHDRGPTDSKKLNERIREQTEEIDELFGDVADLSENINEYALIGSVEAYAMSIKITELDTSYAALDNNTTGKLIVNADKNTVRMDGNGNLLQHNQDVAIVDPLYFDSIASVLTLPQSTHVQKLRIDVNGLTQENPSVTTATWKSFGLETPIDNDEAHAINGKSAEAYYAMASINPGSGGPISATLEYYTTVPVTSNSNPNINVITLIPFPTGIMDLTSLQYADSASPTLGHGSPDFKEFSSYTDAEPANNIFRTNLDQENIAIRRYYINEVEATAIKVVLESDEDVDINGVATRVLGIRQLDVAHTTFGTDGEVVFEITLPSTDLLINSVEPRIINRDVVGIYTPDIEIYWNNGGIWTEMSEGDICSTDVLRVRVLMTDAEIPGTTPLLAGLIIDYS